MANHPTPMAAAANEVSFLSLCFLSLHLSDSFLSTNGSMPVTQPVNSPLQGPYTCSCLFNAF